MTAPPPPAASGPRSCRHAGAPGPPAGCAAARPGPCGQAGLGVVEALVAALVAGLAIVGIALMFGTGSAWVAVLGDDRVALGLAEQQIEQIRDAGWGAALNRLGPSAEACVRLGGRVPAADAGACPVEERTFSRLTCVQYVDAATREALAGPAVTAECAPAVPLGAVPTVRVTVTVAQNGQPKATPIVLQAWLSETGR